MKTFIKACFVMLVMVMMVAGCKNLKVDNDKPVLILDSEREEIIVIEGNPYVEEGCTAVDGNMDISNRVIIDNSKVNTKVPGVYYVIYTVIDNSGNKSIKKRKVTVIAKSTGKPVAGYYENPLYIELNTSFKDPMVDGFNYKGERLPPACIKSDSETSLNPYKLGNYTITYTIEDNENNALTTLQRTIIVKLPVDSPAIELFGSGQTSANYARYGDNMLLESLEPGYRAYDAKDGLLTSPVTITYDPFITWVDVNGKKKIVMDQSQIATPETTPVVTITYSVTDSDGNTATALRYVKVQKDIVPPTITINGNMIYEIESNVSAKYIEPGFGICIDNLTPSNELRKLIKVNGSLTGLVDPQTVGEYRVEYQVVDGYGNPSETLFRIVKVLDRKAPLIEPVLEQNPEFGAYDDMLCFPNASDDYDSGVKGRIVRVTPDYSQFSPYVAGEQFITYTAVDSNFNEASKRIRKVTVKSPACPFMVNGNFERTAPFYDFIKNGYDAIEPNQRFSTDPNYAGDAGDAEGWNLNFYVNSDDGGIENGISTTGKKLRFFKGVSHSYHTGSAGCGFNGDYGGPFYKYYKVCVIKFAGAAGNSNVLMSHGRFNAHYNYTYEFYSSWGTASQSLKVNKNVRYEVSGWFYNGKDGHSHYSQPSSSIRIKGSSGMKFDVDGDDKNGFEVNGDYRIINDEIEKWEQKSISFTPDRNGDIEFFFQKHHEGSGSTCGGDTYFDDASIKIISYPKVQ